MMGNLENISGEGPEVGLGGPFHISGEENPGGSRRYPEDDRLIVDAFVAALRTCHYQRKTVDVFGRSHRRHRKGDGRRSRRRGQVLPGRAGMGRSGIPQAAHRIAPGEGSQPSHVIFVGVGNHHQSK